MTSSRLVLAGWAVIAVLGHSSSVLAEETAPESGTVELTPAERSTDERSQVVFDTRDAYTLLRPHPLNRHLFRQRDAAGSAYSISPKSEHVALLMDASAGSQQVIDAADQGRFHGFYIADTYLGLSPVPGLELNLNLSLFNPSASDGFRFSSSFAGGGALHFYFDYPITGAKWFRADVLATDLGPVTLGSGLLLESTPLEGLLVQFSLDEYYFRHVFGGRVFYDNDDLWVFQLGAYDGLIELQGTGWVFDDGQPLPIYAGASTSLPLLGSAALGHEGLYQWQPLPTALNLKAEYLARFGGVEPVAHGFMSRVDVLSSVHSLANLHLGYQFRYYGKGFGPRDVLQAPTLHVTLPSVEDQYVTNSFEYLGASPVMHQWSHSLMSELQIPLFEHWGLRAELEYLHRFGADPNGPEPFVSLPGGAEFPGAFGKLYYRGSLLLWPFVGEPHRLSLNFTNKQADSNYLLTSNQVDRRYDRGHWVLFLAEAFL